MVWKAKKFSKQFKLIYHKRSNVESTNSVLKRRLMTFLRSKNEIAKTNEILCKCVVFNILLFNRKNYEIELNSDFAQLSSKSAHKLFT